MWVHAVDRGQSFTFFHSIHLAFRDMELTNLETGELSLPLFPFLYFSPWPSPLCNRRVTVGALSPFSTLSITTHCILLQDGMGSRPSRSLSLSLSIPLCLSLILSLSLYFAPSLSLRLSLSPSLSLSLPFFPLLGFVTLESSHSRSLSASLSIFLYLLLGRSTI